MVHRSHLPHILLFLAVLTVLLVPTLASPVHQVHADSSPDLTVDSIWLEKSSSPGQAVTAVAAGDQFLIVASIKNIGTATASNFYLDVYYDSDVIYHSKTVLPHRSSHSPSTPSQSSRVTAAKT